MNILPSIICNIDLPFLLVSILTRPSNCLVYICSSFRPNSGATSKRSTSSMALTFLILTWACGIATAPSPLSILISLFSNGNCTASPYVLFVCVFVFCVLCLMFFMLCVSLLAYCIAYILRCVHSALRTFCVAYILHCVHFALYAFCVVCVLCIFCIHASLTISQNTWYCLAEYHERDFTKLLTISQCTRHYFDM